MKHRASRGVGGGWGVVRPCAAFPHHASQLLQTPPIPAVMHESSRKVTETLQEIYSTEWDGHVELKAIADVSTAVL